MKSQALYLGVFLLRYLDIFYFHSLYNTVMKLAFIGLTGWTVYQIKIKFKATYDATTDSFPYLYLIGIAAIFTVLFHHELGFLEVFAMRRPAQALISCKRYRGL